MPHALSGREMLWLRAHSADSVILQYQNAEGDSILLEDGWHVMPTGGRCSLPAMLLTKNEKKSLHSVCVCSTSHGRGRAPIQATCWRQCGRGSTRSRPMGRQIWQSPSPGASAESSSTAKRSSAATASSSPAGVAPHVSGSDNHTTPHHSFSFPRCCQLAAPLAWASVQESTEVGPFHLYKPPRILPGVRLLVGSQRIWATAALLLAGFREYSTQCSCIPINL